MNASVAAGVEQQVVCSNHLVHGKAIIDTKLGIVVPLTNWAGVDTIKGLNVTLRLPSPHIRSSMVVRTSTGAAVTHSAVSQPAVGIFSATFTLDLDVADALIIR